MAKLLYLASLFSCFTFSTSSPSLTNEPYVVYPINNQRPPVARVGQPFSWSFLPGTFNTSTRSTGLSYQVENLPTWASFTADSHTFSGTPDASYLGTIIVTITAYDATKKKSASDKFRMLVVQGSAPTVTSPLSTQLGNGSVLGSATYDHATGGISVPPSWSWSIGLLPTTFSTANGNGIYYTAYEAGKTSLPSWIKFNTVTATFDGVTPSEPQELSLVVYGSDHFGYGDVQQTFSFRVGQNVLDLTRPLPAINATVESIINYTIPMDGFTIDGTPTNSSTVITPVVDLSATPYLTYQESDFSITGSLPASLVAFTNVSIPIKFTSPRSHNNISTEVFLRVVPGLFVAPVLPPLYIQANQPFSLDLKQYTSNLNATYSLGEISPAGAQSWLHFSTYPLSLSGTAPSESWNTGTEVRVKLEGLGLNNFRSTAELPILLAETAGSKRHGLSPGAKLALEIVLGSFCGLFALILMMRMCRTYCSEDGQRERHEEEDPYNGHYLYASEKYSESRGKVIPAKGTPLSGGETLVDSQSPKWQQPSAGGPMMAVTKNELELSGQSQPSPTGFKRLEVFRVFSKAKRNHRSPSPSHPSVQGLGILSPNHRVINIKANPESGAIEGNDEEDYDSEEGTGSMVAMTGINQIMSSEGHRSSWNTTSSSSLFYSDAPAEGSEGASSRGESWPVHPASTPRRREDFRRGDGKNQRYLSPSSTVSRDGVDIGMIRMISKPESCCISDVGSSEDEVNAFSESIGAIKTASYRKIETSSSMQGTTSSGASSGSSLRPQLIPFHKQPQGKRRSGHSTHSATNTGTLGAATDRHALSTQDDCAADIGAGQRLSVQSGLYLPTGSRSGSPATSAIFFSPPREINWRSTPNNPSPLSASFSPDGKAHSQSPGYKVSRDSKGRLAIPGQYAGTMTETAPIILNVGIGEPFHMNPSMRSKSSTAMSKVNSAPTARVADSDASEAPRYCALTDYPSEPQKDRKQLPEWLHFDAREYEVWGIPRKVDLGLIPIQIIVRKVLNNPSKPSRTRSTSNNNSPNLGRSEEVEEVVARFVLNVVDKSSIERAGHGDVAVVTF